MNVLVVQIYADVNINNPNRRRVDLLLHPKDYSM